MHPVEIEEALRPVVREVNLYLNDRMDVENVDSFWDWQKIEFRYVPPSGWDNPETGEWEPLPDALLCQIAVRRAADADGAGFFYVVSRFWLDVHECPLSMGSEFWRGTEEWANSVFESLHANRTAKWDLEASELTLT